MVTLSIGDLACLVVVVLGLALMGVCAVFVRIAAEQGGKVGIFVLAAIFCVFVICPVLWMGLT